MSVRGQQIRLSTFGTMEVVSTDQGAGRKYRCACGWEGWSSWGHARRHAAGRPQSGRVPDPVGLVPGRPSRVPASSDHQATPGEPGKGETHA